MSGGFYRSHYWTDEDFERIRSVLNVAGIPIETKNALRGVSRIFEADLTIDISRPSRSRAKLLEIKKHGRGLSESFENMDDLTLSAILSSLPNTKTPSIHDLHRDLDRLLRRVEVAIQKLPVDRKGPDEKVWPIRALIGKLKLIYKETTGKRATISKAKESRKGARQNTPKGPFYNFIREYLIIVGYKPHSDIALMRTIEEEIYPPKSV